MKNENVNSNQSPLTNYPLPGIPVDEAWANMSQLLDSNNTAGAGKNNSDGGNKKYLLLLLLLLITAGSVYLWINKKQTKQAEIGRVELTETNNPEKNNNNTNTILKTENNNSSLNANNSSLPLKKIKDGEAVADLYEKQQTPAALKTAAASKRDDDGTGLLNNSGGMKTTAALATVKTRVSVNKLSGTGNSQKGKLTIHPGFNDHTAKAAVLLKAQNKETNNSVNSSDAGEINLAKATKKNTYGTGNSKKERIDTGSSINIIIAIPDNNITDVKNPKLSETLAEQGQKSVITPASSNLAQQKTTEVKKTSKAVKQLGINYGLQWNVALPLQGTKSYFTGTNGSSQPYIALIPDLWLSKQFGKKQELLLMVHLSNLYATGERPLASSKGQLSIIDTTTVTKNLLLLKTSGFTAGLQYNFQVYKRWNIGAGLNYHFLNRALLTEKTTGVYTGSVLSEYTLLAEKNGSNWLYLNSSFVSGKIELSYYLGKIKIGGSLLIPLSDMSSVPGYSIRPVNGQLFLRWRLKK